MSINEHRKKSTIWFLLCAANMAALGWIIGPDIGAAGGVFLFGTVVAAFKTGVFARAIGEKEND